MFFLYLFVRNIISGFVLQMYIWASARHLCAFQDYSFVYCFRVFFAPASFPEKTCVPLSQNYAKNTLMRTELKQFAFYFPFL